MKDPLITPQAQADLEEAWLYVANGGEALADQFLDKIHQLCRQLARFPGIGRDRSNLAANLRSFAVKPFVIFFRPADDTVEIIRILHGRRDIDTIFEEEP